MVVFLFKLIFFALSFVSSLVLGLIFSATARVLVLLIHGFRAPGLAIHGTLQQVTEVTRSCSEYFVGLVLEAISALVSAFFDYLKQSVTGSAGVTTSAIGDLMEKTKTSLELLDGLLTDFPEVSEMIFTMVADLWNNCRDAFGYVAENA
ncbi:PREDICTED: uncharacterized protein LOC103334274 [Prunus mume]|uniref:Uncharacterized protein LOC103334274 n=1 Tax=Prunus mume TaxID=102107 RepID=A0ABM0P7G3_PRUMU|nr:PREDICTED: uncharacterized protein LOC103334274 [Prunus mume]